MKSSDPAENALKVEVTFYGWLKYIFKNNKTIIDLKNAPDIRTLFKLLCVSDECRIKLFDNNGNLQPNIIVVRNGRNIRFENELDTRLDGGDTIAIFPPVAGG